MYSISNLVKIIALWTRWVILRAPTKALNPAVVRVEGLEPPRRQKPLDPKSSVSTNSTTPALRKLWGFFFKKSSFLTTFLQKQRKEVWGLRRRCSREWGEIGLFFRGRCFSIERVV